jgi:threonine-phosphate decarboxylase
MYQHGGDIYNNKVNLDFSSNINLMGIPKGVLRAAKRGVELSFCYPDTECNELREAISISEGIPKDMIVCGNGAADLIFSLVLTTKPKKALLLAPTFQEYEQALQSVDCEIRYHRLLEEHGYQLRTDFIEQITEDIDIIFLCNPNNPTGVLIERSLLESILKKCEDSDCILVVDECFMDFVAEGKEHTLKEYCKSSIKLIVLKAFTKLYAMPGLRLGYGFCGDTVLINQMKHTSQPWSVSIPAQMAGIAALKEVEYVKQSLQKLEREKNFLLQELRQLNYKIYGSKANYIFFRAEEDNASKPQPEATDIQLADRHGYLYIKCLEQGVLIRDCSNYRGLTEGYYRIVVKAHEENIRLIEVLKTLT